MVQRSSTHIVRSDTLMDVGLGALYSEEAVRSGVTTEKADLIFASLPYRILHEFQIPAYAEMKKRDADFYEGLEKAGFWLDWGDDESGLFLKYLRRGSGYYIDIGASQLIIDGEIKLKRGQVTEIVEDGVILDDGTKLEADVIVYATGYGSMNGWVADLMGQDMADRLARSGVLVPTPPRTRSLGRRTAEHVETDPAGSALVPRWQPAPVAPLLPVSGATAESADGRPADPGLRPSAGASPVLTGNADRT